MIRFWNSRQNQSWLRLTASLVAVSFLFVTAATPFANARLFRAYRNDHPLNDSIESYARNLSKFNMDDVRSRENLGRLSNALKKRISFLGPFKKQGKSYIFGTYLGERARLNFIFQISEESNREKVIKDLQDNFRRETDTLRTILGSFLGEQGANGELPILRALKMFFASQGKRVLETYKDEEARSFVVAESPFELSEEGTKGEKIVQLWGRNFGVDPKVRDGKLYCSERERTFRPRSSKYRNNRLKRMSNQGKVQVANVSGQSTKQSFRNQKGLARSIARKVQSVKRILNMAVRASLFITGVVGVGSGGGSSASGTGGSGHKRNIIFGKLLMPERFSSDQPDFFQTRPLVKGGEWVVAEEEVKDDILEFISAYGKEFEPIGYLVSLGSDGGQITINRGHGTNLDVTIRYGTGPGEFANPISVALDMAGNVWIVDRDNHRLQMLDSVTGEWKVIGKKGTGPGEFKHPATVAIDVDGNLWVWDRGNKRIQVRRNPTSYVSIAASSQSSQSTALAAVDPTEIERVRDEISQLQAEVEAILEKPEITQKDVERADELARLAGEKLKLIEEKAVMQAGNSSEQTDDPTEATPVIGKWDVMGEVGKAGKGLGEFDQPVNIAFDPDGNLWVADLLNRRLQMRDKNTGEWSSIGKRGTGPGEFTDPCSIAFDSAGNLWVADFGNNCLQIREKDTNEWTIIGREGRGLGEFNVPVGIAFDKKGNLWVVDNGNNRLQMRNKNSGEWKEFGGFGSLPGQFRQPWGIAFDPDGNLWVTDQDNHRIQMRDKSTEVWEEFGKKGKIFGEEGTMPGEFKSPKSLAFDKEGNLWVADSSNHRIQMRDKITREWKIFGKYGSEPGELHWPWAIAFDPDGLLWVVDTNNERLLFGKKPSSADSISLSGINHTLDLSGTLTLASVIAGLLISPYLLVFSPIFYGIFYGASWWSKEFRRIVSSGRSPPSDTEQQALLARIQQTFPKYKFIPADIPLLSPARASDKTIVIDLKQISILLADKSLTEQEFILRSIIEHHEALHLAGFPHIIIYPYQMILTSLEHSVRELQKINVKHFAMNVLRASLFITGVVGMSGAGSGGVSGGKDEEQAESEIWSVVAGSVHGGFTSPRGVVFDPEGNLWVADSDNHRLQMRDKDSGAWYVIGKQGTEPGEFRHPTDITFDKEGNLWVLDMGNCRLQMRDKDTWKWEAFGKRSKKGRIKPGEFFNPRSIAIDNEGNLWVVNALDDEIIDGGGWGTTHHWDFTLQMRDKDTGEWRVIEGKDKEPAEFPELSSLAFDKDGNLWVVSYDGNLSCQSLLKMRDKDTGDWIEQGKFTNLFKRIAFDLEGNLWGVGAWSIFAQDKDNREWIKFGKRGTEPGEFENSYGIAFDKEGNIWVADTGNNRLQVRKKHASSAQTAELAPPQAQTIPDLSSADQSEVERVRQEIKAIEAEVEAILAKGEITPQDVARADELARLAEDKIRMFEWQAGSQTERVEETPDDQADDISIPGGWTVVGKEGSEPGEFINPDGIAFDSKGNLWVTDVGNHRLQMRDKNTEEWKEFGKQGTEPGEFNYPDGIAFDMEGNLWVSDLGNDHLQMRDKNTEEWTVFGKQGTKPGEFNKPRGIAFDSKGNLWVSDWGNDRLQMRDKKTGKWEVVGKRGTKPGKFNGPKGIAFDSKGNLWVSEFGNAHLQMRDKNTEEWTVFGKHGTEPGEFNDPRGIAFDSEGKLWVSDLGNHHLQVCSNPKKADQSSSNPSQAHQMSLSGIDFTRGLSGSVALGFLIAALLISPYILILAPMFYGIYYGATWWSKQFTRMNSTGLSPPTQVEQDVLLSRLKHTFPKYKFIPADLTLLSPARAQGKTIIVDLKQISNLLAGKSLKEQDFMLRSIIEHHEALHLIGLPHIIIYPYQMILTALNNSVIRLGRVDIKRFAMNVLRAPLFITGIMGVGGVGGIPSSEEWSVVDSVETVVGGFQYPNGMALDPEGNLWVVDEVHNCFQKRDKTTGKWTIVGSGGTGPGEFNKPSRIAFDKEGNLWVTDTDNNRIQKMDRVTGIWIVFGKQGRKPGELYTPYGIAFDKEGNLWVSEWNNNRLQMWDKDKEEWIVVGKKGKETGEFDYPRDITFDKEGNLWVVDVGNERLQMRNKDTREWIVVGKKGKGPGEFDNPRSISFDLEGNLWVSEWGNQRLQMWNKDTGKWKVVGKEGTGLGEFKYPDGILFDQEGNLWVSDRDNHRLQVRSHSKKSAQPLTGVSTIRLSASDIQRIREEVEQIEAEVQAILDQGYISEDDVNKADVLTNLALEKINLIKEQEDLHARSTGDSVRLETKIEPLTLNWRVVGKRGAGPGEFTDPKALAFDPYGNLWVIEGGRHRIQKRNKNSGEWIIFGREGPEPSDFKSPNAIAFDSAGFLWLVASGSNALQMKSRDPDSRLWYVEGRQGEAKGQFEDPKAITFDSRGNPWVSDSGNHRLQTRVHDTGYPDYWVAVKEGIGSTWFNYPFGIAFDPLGNMWISEMGAHRLQMKDKDTGKWSVFGKQGTGPGEFNNPKGIAFDPDGNLWVVDSGNERLQIRNKDTGEWTVYGKEGIPSTNFQFPPAIVFDKEGNLWLVDTMNNRILVGEKPKQPAQTVTPPSTGEISTGGSKRTVGDGFDISISGINYTLNISGTLTLASVIAGLLISPYLLVFSPIFYGIFYGASWWSKQFARIASSGLSPPSDVEQQALLARIKQTYPKYKFIPADLPLLTPAQVRGNISQDLNFFSSFFSPARAQDKTIVVDLKQVSNLLAGKSHKEQEFMLRSIIEHHEALHLKGLPHIVIYPYQMILTAIYNSLIRLQRTDIRRFAMNVLKAPLFITGVVGMSGAGGIPGGTDDPEESSSDQLDSLQTQLLIEGGEWSVIGKDGTEPGEFKDPLDIAFDSEGNLWVVDTYNDRLQRMDKQTGRWSVIVGKGGSEGDRFSKPSGIVIDPKGNLWIADTNNHRLQMRLKDTGEWIIIGKQGTGDGEFINPTGIAFDSEGNLWVADTGNSRLQTLSGIRYFWSSIGKQGTAPGEFNSPTDIAFDSEGNLWVVDALNHRLKMRDKNSLEWKVIGKEGHGLGEFNGPNRIAFDREGNLWVADSHNHRLQIRDKQTGDWTVIGKKGSGKVEFIIPAGIAFDLDGNVVIADSINSRLQVHKNQRKSIKDFFLPVVLNPSGESLSKGNFNWTAYSPDDKLVGFGSYENDFTKGCVPKLFNFETGEKVENRKDKPYELKNYRGAFSPDGKRIVTVSPSLVAGQRDIVHIEIRDIRTGRVISTTQDILRFTVTAPGGLDSVAFSNDGKIIAISDYKDNHFIVRLYDADSGEPKINRLNMQEVILKSYSDSISPISFSHDNKKVVVFTKDGGYMFDVETGEPITKDGSLILLSPLESGGTVVSTSFSPDDKTILAVVEKKVTSQFNAGNGTFRIMTFLDQKIEFWNADTGEHLIHGRDGQAVIVPINHVQFGRAIFADFLPDGQGFVTVHDSGAFLLWKSAAETTAPLVEIANVTDEVLQRVREEIVQLQTEVEAILAKGEITQDDVARAKFLADLADEKIKRLEEGSELLQAESGEQQSGAKPQITGSENIAKLAIERASDIIPYDESEPLLLSLSGIDSTRNLSGSLTLGSLIAGLLISPYLLILVPIFYGIYYGASWWGKQFARINARGLSPPFYLEQQALFARIQQTFPKYKFIPADLPLLSPARAQGKAIVVDLKQISHLLAGKSPKEQEFMLRSIIKHHEALHLKGLPHIIIYPYQMILTAFNNSLRELQKINIKRFSMNVLRAPLFITRVVGMASAGGGSASQPPKRKIEEKVLLGPVAEGKSWWQMGMTGHWVAYSPDSNIIAFGGCDKDYKESSLIRYWDFKTGEQIKSPLDDSIDLKGYRSATPSTVFSPDGEKVLVRRINEKMEVREINSGKIIVDHENGELANSDTRLSESVAYSPDGKIIAVSGSVYASDAFVKLYDSKSGKHILNETTKEPVILKIPTKNEVVNISFSGDSNRVVVCAGRHNVGINEGTRAYLFDAMTGKQIEKDGEAIVYHPFHSDEKVMSTNFSPDGKMILGVVRGKWGRVFIGSGDGWGHEEWDEETIQFWNSETGELIMDVDGLPMMISIDLLEYGNVLFADFLPNGEGVITYHESGALLLWKNKFSTVGSPATFVGEGSFLPSNILSLLARLERNFQAERAQILSERANRKMQIASEVVVPSELDPNEELISADGQPVKVREIREGAWQVSYMPQRFERFAEEPTIITGDSSQLNTIAQRLNNPMGRLWIVDNSGLEGTQALEALHNLFQVIQMGPEYLHAEILEGFAPVNPERWPLIVFQPRALDKNDENIRISDQSVSATILDLVLYVAHNHEQLLKLGQGITVLIPMLETAKEAILWEKILRFIEHELNLPQGTIHTILKIDTLQSQMELEEILWAMKERMIAVSMLEVRSIQQYDKVGEISGKRGAGGIINYAQSQQTDQLADRVLSDYTAFHLLVRKMIGETLHSQGLRSEDVQKYLMENYDPIVRGNSESQQRVLDELEVHGIDQPAHIILLCHDTAVRWISFYLHTKLISLMERSRRGEDLQKLLEKLMDEIQGMLDSNDNNSFQPIYDLARQIKEEDGAYLHSPMMDYMLTYGLGVMMGAIGNTMRTRENLFHAVLNMAERLKVRVNLLYGRTEFIREEMHSIGGDIMSRAIVLFNQNRWGDFTDAQIQELSREETTLAVQENYLAFKVLTYIKGVKEFIEGTSSPKEDEIRVLREEFFRSSIVQRYTTLAIGSLVLLDPILLEKILEGDFRLSSAEKEDIQEWLEIEQLLERKLGNRVDQSALFPALMNVVAMGEPLLNEIARREGLGADFVMRAEHHLEDISLQEAAILIVVGKEIYEALRQSPNQEDAFSLAGTLVSRNLSVFLTFGAILAAIFVSPFILIFSVPLIGIAYGAEWWIKKFRKMKSAGLSPPSDVEQQALLARIQQTFPKHKFIPADLPLLSPARASGKSIVVDLEQMSNLLAGKSPKEQDFMLRSIIKHHEALHLIGLPHIIIYSYQMILTAFYNSLRRLQKVDIKRFAMALVRTPLFITGVVGMVSVSGGASFNSPQIKFFKWKEIGKRGTKQGEFVFPRGIAFDSKGNFWVADGFGRLQRKDKDTGAWSVVGKKGTRPGEFYDPHGIAFDIEGNLWVADTGNNRLQRKNKDSKDWTVVERGGTMPSEFHGFRDIAFDPDGNLWVEDFYNHRIQMRDKNTGVWTTIGKRGTGLGEFYDPHGIAFDQGGNLWVADSRNHRIQMRDKNTGIWTAIGEEGTEPGKFGYPRCITFDSDGNLWVGERGNNRLQVRDKNTGNWTVVLNKGSKLGKFRCPEYITFDSDGNLWMSEYFKHNLRVCKDSRKFDLSSSRTQSVKFPLAPRTQKQNLIKSIVALSASDIQRLTNELRAMEAEVKAILEQSEITPKDVERSKVLAKLAMRTIKDLEGINIDQVSSPIFIGISPDRKVYVVEAEGLVIVDPDLRGIEGKIKIDGFDDRNIAIAPDGKVWISEKEEEKSYIFDPVAKSLENINLPELKGAEDIAIAPNGIVYFVKSSEGKLFFYDPVTKQVGQTGKYGKKEGELFWPRRVMCAPDGKVWVADSHQIQSFDPTTGIWESTRDEDIKISMVGGRRYDGGHLEFAHGPDGKIYVVDISNGLRSYDPSSREWKIIKDISIYSAQSIKRSYAIKFDSDGKLYLNHPGGKKLIVYDPMNEKITARVNGLFFDIATADDGTVWLIELDKDGHYWLRNFSGEALPALDLSSGEKIEDEISNFSEESLEDILRAIQPYLQMEDQPEKHNSEASHESEDRNDTPYPQFISFFGIKWMQNLSGVSMVGTLIAALLISPYLLVLVPMFYGIYYGAGWWSREFARIASSGLSPPSDVEQQALLTRIQETFPKYKFIPADLPLLSPARASGKSIEVDLKQISHLLAGKFPKEQEFMLRSIIEHHEALHLIGLPHIIIYPYQMLIVAFHNSAKSFNSIAYFVYETILSFPGILKILNVFAEHKKDEWTGLIKGDQNRALDELESSYGDQFHLQPSWLSLPALPLGSNLTSFSFSSMQNGVVLGSVHPGLLASASGIGTGSIGVQLSGDFLNLKFGLASSISFFMNGETLSASQIGQLAFHPMETLETARGLLSDTILSIQNGAPITREKDGEVAAVIQNIEEILEQESKTEVEIYPAIAENSEDKNILLVMNSANLDKESKEIKQLIDKIEAEKNEPDGLTDRNSETGDNLAGQNRQLQILVVTDPNLMDEPKAKEILIQNGILESQISAHVKFIHQPMGEKGYSFQKVIEAIQDIEDHDWILEGDYSLWVIHNRYWSDLISELLNSFLLKNGSELLEVDLKSLFATKTSQ